MNIREQALKAASRYFRLVNPEAELLGEEDGFKVFLTDEGYVFINVTYSTNGFHRSDREQLRKEFVKAMVSFYEHHDDVPNNQSIRCDEIALHILGERRALLEHCTNAINEEVYHG
jgi:hypothetical protein